MATGKFDPLEAAKLPRRSAAGRSVEPATPMPPASDDAVLATQPSEPTPPAAAEPTKYRRYRVKRSQRVMLQGGGVTHVNAGDVVSEKGYGERGLTRLRDQGVELEEIAE